MSLPNNANLELKALKPLMVQQALQPGRPNFISAASGIVKIEDQIFVISDDENSLGRFTLEGASPGILYPLSEDRLPLDPVARKKLKPDLEALTEINWAGTKGLLAVPSGATPQRNKGYWIELGENLDLVHIKAVDFSLLFKSLDIPDLNIEAAFQIEGHVALLHRGNSIHSRNAFILCNLENMREELKSGAFLSECREMTFFVDLGPFQKAKLGFTDACYFRQDQFLYLAVSEATEDTYNDGAFLGAELGCMNIQGEILYRQKLDIAEKPEGICVMSYSSPQDILIVTDSDDPKIPSQLYCAKIPDFE